MAIPNNNVGIVGATRVTKQRPEGNSKKRNYQQQISLNLIRQRSDNENNEDYNKEKLARSPLILTAQLGNQQTENSTKKLIGILNQTNNRVKLIRTVGTVVWLLVYLYLAQLAFAIMSLIFIAFEGATGLGESIFWIGHIIAIVLGLIASAIMFGVLIASNNNFMQGKKIMYMITIILHVAPILNLFPLVGIWFLLLLFDSE